MSEWRHDCRKTKPVGKSRVSRLRINPYECRNFNPVDLRNCRPFHVKTCSRIGINPYDCRNFNQFDFRNSIPFYLRNHNRIGINPFECRNFSPSDLRSTEPFDFHHQFDLETTEVFEMERPKPYQVESQLFDVTNVAVQFGNMKLFSSGRSEPFCFQVGTLPKGLHCRI